MDKRILIGDSSVERVDSLVRLLADRYKLERASSGQECLEKLRTFGPDLVVLEASMPGIDGYETCCQIKDSPYGDFTQVMLVSQTASMPERLRGYEVGADDYLARPFDDHEFLAKVRVLFRLRDTLKQLWSANAKIQKFNAELERAVQERTAEVVATRDIAIFALAKLAESRDPETGEHLERIRSYCRILAEQLHEEGPYRRQIDTGFIEDIYRSSPLHDIGKVGIPDSILLKPGRLTQEEFAVMKRHTTIGADALQEAVERNRCGGFLEMAIDVARHHHERFDGTGYPEGLSGHAIPLSARITALADVFDALTSERVYRQALDPDVARSMIEAEKGSHFDPAIVEAFQVRYSDFLAVLGARQPHFAVHLVTAGRSDDVRR